MTMLLVPAKKVEPKDKHVSKLTPTFLALQAGEFTLRTWRLSWDKDEHTFHLRDAKNLEFDLYVHSIDGFTEIVESDGVNGRIMLRHAMMLDDKGNATFLNVSAETPSEGAVSQMCFSRAEHKWRIWQRGERPLTEQIIDGYSGLIHAFWPRDDHGGHILTKTPFQVIDGLAVFG